MCNLLAAANTAARDSVAAMYRSAIVEKRIKVSRRRRGYATVTIEPRQQAVAA
jgi:hypothetical protein